MKLRNWVVGFVALCIMGLFLFIAGYLVIYLNGQKLLMENLEKFNVAETTVVYDRKGEEFARLYTQNRELVALAQVPDLLEQAIVATEDQRFYEHVGVDFWSIGRAIVKDIVARDLVEGGSTITQQLAKNMFLTADKTFFRKATEVSIALALENNFSKAEILERYLNYIYYGNGAYGVKAAAERHFGVSDLNELSLLEIAVLAGMPKAPETYSPSNNPKRAVERAAVVLSLMEDQGYISPEERSGALSGALREPPPRSDRAASAIRDYVLAQAAKMTGISENELRIGGFQIHTTVDSAAQRAMDAAFADPERLPEDGAERAAQGAMVIIDPHTGGVVAMNGGRNYVEKGFNRATAKRQPGSAFKPLAVYAPALESGLFQPQSVLKDEKRTYGDYSPTNLSGKYAGEMTMLEAVQRSVNAPAVWLLNEIGVAKGLAFAASLGVDMDPGDRNLAIALGGLTKGASPLEMARAYGSFAAGGLLADTHVIAKVLRRDGSAIYEHRPAAVRVMKETTAHLTTYLLQSVTSQGGTGTRAYFGRPVAGKTGTTQLGLRGVDDASGNRDIWFAGYTPQYAAAVWMGFDDTDESHYVKSGSGMAAAMFAAVMEEAMKGMEVREFARAELPEEPEPQAPPPSVSDLTAAYDASLHEIELTWTPLENGEFQYRLYRKETGGEAAGAPFEMMIETALTTIVDVTMLPGRTYQYYVTVYDADAELESGPSNMVEVTVPEGTAHEDDMMELPDILPGQEGSDDGSDSEAGGGTDDGTDDGTNEGSGSEADGGENEQSGDGSDDGTNGGGDSGGTGSGTGDDTGGGSDGETGSGTGDDTDGGSAGTTTAELGQSG